MFGKKTSLLPVLRRVLTCTADWHVLLAAVNLLSFSLEGFSGGFLHQEKKPKGVYPWPTPGAILPY